MVIYYICRSQWPRGLRRRSAAARLLRSWVRIPPGAWIIECCVLSGRGLCDELITRPEESYRLWCVVECDLETSRMRRPWPALGRSATKKKIIYIFIYKYYIPLWCSDIIERFTSSLPCFHIYYGSGVFVKSALRNKRYFTSSVYLLSYIYVCKCCIHLDNTSVLL